MGEGKSGGGFNKTLGIHKTMHSIASARIVSDLSGTATLDEPSMVTCVGASNPKPANRVPRGAKTLQSTEEKGHSLGANKQNLVDPRAFRQEDNFFFYRPGVPTEPEIPGVKGKDEDSLLQIKPEPALISSTNS